MIQAYVKLYFLVNISLVHRLYGFFFGSRFSKVHTFHVSQCSHSIQAPLLRTEFRLLVKAKKDSCKYKILIFITDFMDLKGHVTIPETWFRSSVVSY